MVMPVFEADCIRARTFVAHVESHHELASTNDRALELSAARDVPLPALVIAGQQTAGRGRGGNRWWAREGALTFSLILDAAELELPPALWPRLSLTAGLSVCQALEQTLADAGFPVGGHVGLKWPNDVHLEGRKVCGILVEVPPQSEGRGRGRLVVGIGVNVNNSMTEAPSEIRQSAVSLCDRARSDFDLNNVLINILVQFERDLQGLRQDSSALSRRWRELCVLRGHTVSLQAGGRQPVGTCEGIDEDGALVLRTEAGIERFFAGVATRIV